MHEVGVTVVPVALRPGDEEFETPALSVAAFRPGAEWLTATVKPSEALDSARRLLDSALPLEATGEHAVAANTRLENAGVEYSSGTPKLLFTAVLPIAAAELRRDGWRELVHWPQPSERNRVQSTLDDPVGAAIASYWRDQLVRTTAAFDFLLKYFPASQVRAIYASVWGESQVDSNFQRWLTTARDVNEKAICAEVPDEAVRAEAQAAFARRLSSSGAAAAGATAASVASAWDPKFVGTSGRVSALSGLSVIPAAVIAGAIVGSVVSWQNSRATGRPPSRYRRVNQERTGLRTWYPMRPDDTTSGSTFVGQP